MLLCLEDTVLLERDRAFLGEDGSFSWLPMVGEQMGMQGPGRAPPLVCVVGLSSAVTAVGAAARRGPHVRSSPCPIPSWQRGLGGMLGPP